ncbi:MAG: M20 family metallopeptidase [Planctomycetaceae bacterium]
MDPVSIAKELIAIPSVNPMGRDLAGPQYFETRLTAYLIDFFKQLGVPYEQIEVAPGRSNVIARYEAGVGKPTVLFDAHQDTVPVDGMTIDPFDPVISNGRLYGRGACDDKGPLAAMLAAFARLVDERPAGAANLVMSCTCDEESTVMGIIDLVEMWSGSRRASQIIPAAPTCAVVAEPTGLDVVVAHRGATRWKIKTTGIACHSSRPSDGVNAIYRMAKVLDCLEKYAAKLPDLIPLHPLCGPATLSVGRIEGGQSVNTVPDFCAIEIDRRVVPGEDSLAVIDQLAEYLREGLDFEVEHLPPWSTGIPLSDDDNGPLAERLIDTVTAVVGPTRKLGVPYGTHASRIAATGVPSVVFGPGSIEQAHTRDEWVSIEQLEQASDVYYRFCLAGG